MPVFSQFGEIVWQLLFNIGIESYRQLLLMSSGWSHCQSHQALVLPIWKSSFFCNAFTRDGVLWNRFVVNWFQGLFVPEKMNGPQFPSLIQVLRFWLRSAWSQFSVPQISLLPGGLLFYALQNVLPVLLVAFYGYTFRSEAIRFCT